MLTSNEHLQSIEKMFEEDNELNNISFLHTNDLSNISNNTLVQITKEDIAFLQYTSGSTGNPKGVMVSHENLMNNMEVLYKSFGHSLDSKMVSWLPMFHDMGLIGGVLQPLYGGFEAVLMSPTYFLQKPIRWLDAISKYKATSSGAPNFAYDLCVQSIKEEELDNIDLSHWVVAANGAEPISSNTLLSFTQKFSKYGFSHQSHHQSYGMAESTLMISSIQTKDEPKILSIDVKQLEQGKIHTQISEEENSKQLVSCGAAWLNHDIIIVNESTLEKAKEDEVGEIWVKGESIAKGYWNNEEKTTDTFYAYTNDNKDGPYLRTGDLGFIHEEELYICGRSKDMLIIRGKNYYPQDIENICVNTNIALGVNGTAAFTIEVKNEEKLVIVAEVKRTHIRKINDKEIFTQIKKSISQEFDIEIYDIILIKPAHLLKTSSGKVQRYNNKKSYLNNSFKNIASLRKENTNKLYN